MKYITLIGTDITTSAIGLGCAGMMRMTSSSKRQALLNQAFDSGVRHFDVARMYGLGVVESEVGKFLKNKRDQVTVASKFGIEVGKNRKSVAMVQWLIRRIISASPRLQKMARKQAGKLYLPRKYDVLTATKSLHASLRELGTDYLDMFFLHEPTLSDINDTDIVEFLEKSKQDGVIRAYGIAGYPEDIMPICGEMPELRRLIQIPNDIIGQQKKQFEHYNSAIITFGALSSALGVLAEYINSTPVVSARWCSQTGCDLTNVENIAHLLLAYCLNDNCNGVVLFSTTKIDRVKEMCKVASEYKNSSDILESFINIINAEREQIHECYLKHGA